MHVVVRWSVAIVATGSVKDIAGWKESIVVGCPFEELVLVHGDEDHALKWGGVVRIVMLWDFDDEL